MAIAALGAVVAATFTSSLDGALAGRSLSPAAARTVDEARDRTLTRADTRGLASDEARAVARAVEDASLKAFRMGIGIATALVALGGVLGLVGIVNPRRAVSAAGCAGAQLVGMPEEVALQRAAQPVA
jgi:hypothetical protein